MAPRQKVLGRRGGEFINSSKVMTLKSYLAIGALNMLLTSYAAMAAQDVRGKRSEDDNDLGSAEMEGSGTDTESTHEGTDGGGSSGGGTMFMLGIISLVCAVIYCIGIGYKIFKIVKGTYQEEEPVFLKYK